MENKDSGHNGGSFILYIHINHFKLFVAVNTVDHSLEKHAHDVSFLCCVE